jgi:hypothetical protein
VKWRNYLWQEPHPASAAAIAAAEKALGVRFPADYRKVVREHQGQVPQPSLFDFDEGGARTTGVMGPLFHFRPEKDAAAHAGYHLLEVHRKRQHLLPKGVVPFSEDPAGNLIAFDYRRSKSAPGVVFLNQERAGGEGWITPLAGSFSDFLGMLHEDRGG